MSWFRKSQPESTPDVRAFDSWKIVTTTGGREFTLDGYMSESVDPAEFLRYVDAIADGLRAAGFDAAVTLTRKEVSTR